MGTVTAAAAIAAFEVRCAGPIRYGADDCAALAAEALQAVTGIDAMRPYRGRYRTPRGFLRIIRRAGLADLPQAVEAAAAAAGWPRIEHRTARDLDLALAVSRGVASVGLVKGGFVVMRVEGGLAAVPLAATLAVWRTTGAA